MVDGRVLEHRRRRSGPPGGARRAGALRRPRPSRRRRAPHDHRAPRPGGARSGDPGPAPRPRRVLRRAHRRPLRPGVVPQRPPPDPAVPAAGRRARHRSAPVRRRRARRHGGGLLLPGRLRRPRLPRLPPPHAGDRPQHRRPRLRPHRATRRASPSATATPSTWSWPPADGSRSADGRSPQPSWPRHAPMLEALWASSRTASIWRSPASRVLNKDKVLAAIPLISSVVCGVVLLVFGAGALAATGRAKDTRAPGTDRLQRHARHLGDRHRRACFVVGFIAQFFTAVLIAGANERLEGGNPTIGSAFGKASSRVGSILGWAVDQLHRRDDPPVHPGACRASSASSSAGWSARRGPSSPGSPSRSSSSRASGRSTPSSARPTCSSRPGARTSSPRSDSASVGPAGHAARASSWRRRRLARLAGRTIALFLLWSSSSARS